MEIHRSLLLVGLKKFLLGSETQTGREQRGPRPGGVRPHSPPHCGAPQGVTVPSRRPASAHLSSCGGRSRLQTSGPGWAGGWPKVTEGQGRVGSPVAPRHRRPFLGPGGRPSGLCCGWPSSLSRPPSGARIPPRGPAGAAAQTAGASRDACGVKSAAHPRPLAAPGLFWELELRARALPRLSPELLEAWSGVRTGPLLSCIHPVPRTAPGTAGPDGGGAGCLACRGLASARSPARGAGRAATG